MRVILDTNVILDVLLARRPFVEPATRVFSLAEQSQIEGYLCATTITTVDYLLTRSLVAKEARQATWRLLELFEIAIVNRPVIEEALRSRVTDFEDAVIDQAGRLAAVEAVVTRNVRDFRHASLRVFDPVEFLSQLEL